VTVICRAESLPGETERLARKSPCDEVGANASDVSDVAVVRHVGPVSFEDFAGIGFDFREADGGVSSRLRGEREAADSRKEVKVSSTGWRTIGCREPGHRTLVVFDSHHWPGL